MENICVKCQKREAEYDAPDIWCEKCWRRWWDEGVYDTTSTIKIWWYRMKDWVYFNTWDKWFGFDIE